MTSLQLEKIDALRHFAAQFGKKFVLGTISNGPEDVWFNLLKITQFGDMTCTIHGDDKLSALASYPLSLVRSQQCSEQMNEVQKHANVSICSSLGWL